MTPDQLKVYVDAALQQQDHLGLLLLALTVVISIGGSFLIAYLQEKGKNQATKEDVEGITSKIENAKAFFSERLEHLKSELSTRSHFSQLRYGREMEVFKELWSRAFELQKAVQNLKASSLLNKPDDQTQVDSYFEAFRAMEKTVWENRPFYPNEIWKEVNGMLNLLHDQAAQHYLGAHAESAAIGEQRLQLAIKNEIQIEELTLAVCEAIRSRLQKFDI